LLEENLLGETGVVKRRKNKELFRGLTYLPLLSGKKSGQDEDGGFITTFGSLSKGLCPSVRESRGRGPMVTL